MKIIQLKQQKQLREQIIILETLQNTPIDKQKQFGTNEINLFIND